MADQTLRHSLRTNRRCERPLIEQRHDQVERLAGIGCTDAEIAAVAGRSTDTLARRKRDDPAFVEVLERGKAICRAKLRLRQWQRALAGSTTMMISLGKCWLGQTDKVALSGEKAGAVAVEVVYCRPGEKGQGMSKPKPGILLARGNRLLERGVGRASRHGLVGGCSAC